MDNSKKIKIAFLLGTKAQFIKSKYILESIGREGIELLILDTGQHKEITKKELEDLNINYKKIEITNSQKNISTIPSMLYWFLKFIFSIKKDNSFNSIEYCLLHGDTLSTLMGLIYCKKNKVKTVHIEAGYKSYNYLKPFPEEIIRDLVSKFSDILVVDGPKQYENIKKYNNKKEIIQISRNTVYDSLIKEVSRIEVSEKNQLSVTVHRTENIYNNKNLDFLVNILIEIKEDFNFDIIKWFCHDVTHSVLVRKNYKKKLIENGIELSNLLPYKEFINEIYNSKAIITDGGSIAEESSILGLNTIIWRDVVENKDYLNHNVILSKYKKEKIYDFLNNMKKNKIPLDKSQSPSQEFVEQFIKRLS
tara:strand:- start:79 stop:1167 length:1089 start_codon:yes stop_codon:yes gene_type:complete